jgi:periplasmic copper chaperone A
MTSRRVAILLAVLLAVLLALVAAACGSGSSTNPGPSVAGGPLTVRDAWVRAAPSGADTAAYFTIFNGCLTDDTLMGVTATIARSAGLHQTTTDPSGMTGMQMAPQVKVPKCGTVQFAPGGYHVMLMGVTSELKTGDTVLLQLSFQNAGVVKVTAAVRTS